MPVAPIAIALFASGKGSNAQKIIDYFRNDPLIHIGLIVCNKPGAGVTDIAKKEKIPLLLIEKERFFRGDNYLPELKGLHIRFIVLAGFLWKVPGALIQTYSERILNIHPALLPAYGGKGMYGMHVHEAVIRSSDKESGISIHLVDEVYDHGRLLFQARVKIEPDDTPETLAAKIHSLEHMHFARVIKEWISDQNIVKS